jgi:spermidine synthase
MKKEKGIKLAQFDPNQSRKMDLWYQDSLEYEHGCGIRIKITDILFQIQSKFQEISVLQSENMGKVLVIDGITMLTEFDEFAYHEMITHVPLITHNHPGSVLVIGGGDGGTVREIVKHKGIEKIDVCEIDKEVVNVCRQHLPFLAGSFDDPRVKIFYEDGAAFMKEKAGHYDVIIVDSTDPIGPGQILFQEPFYRDMKKALKPDGIAVTQCESIFLHQDVIRGVYGFARKLYPQIRYYYTAVPTYPSGMIGFMFCSLENDPVVDLDEKRAGAIKDLRYYSPAVHRAAFTLPKFAEEYFQI